MLKVELTSYINYRSASWRIKESRETVYWLRLIKKSNLVSITSFDVLIQEARELTNIIAKSIVTAKKK